MITFAKAHLKSIPSNSNVSLMDQLLAAGIPVASSCKGDGICGKCKVAVLDGFSNINKESDLEKACHEKQGLKPNERLSCQIFLSTGEVKIDTPYW